MKVLVAGHTYEAANFENPEEKGQTVQFIHKEPKLGEDGKPTSELITVSDGTTNEELLSILIDRVKFLQAKFPCKENAMAITHMEEAENWLHRRTRERLARNVEGKHIA